jgi:Peptidase of plants and bacteria
MKIRLFALFVLLAGASVYSADDPPATSAPIPQAEKSAEKKSDTPQTPATAEPKEPSANPTEKSSPYEITIDYSETPELKDWVETKLRPTLEEWYPIIVADLPSNGFTPPQKFTVTIKTDYRGVAATGGTHVTVSATWIKQQMDRPKSEAVGSVVHELVHVDQQYGRARGRNRVPGWLTEGIADYIRWWKYEPPENRHPVRATKRDGTPASYKDSYQTTAAFLEYVVKNYDHELVVKFNTAGREGTYSPELWEKYTGKDVDDLWIEFAATLKN